VTPGPGLVFPKFFTPGQEEKLRILPESTPVAGPVPPLLSGRDGHGFGYKSCGFAVFLMDLDWIWIS